MAAKESNPLLGDAASDENSPVEKMQTAASIVSLVAIAVLKTQLTAFLFKYSNFPTAYSLWSCVVTIVLLMPFFLIKPSSFGVPSSAMAPVLTLIVVFTALDLGMTNIALSEVSTALQQCIAATNPFWTIVIETAVHRRVQHPFTYVVVTLLVVGAVLSGLGSVEKLSVFGVLAAVIGVLSSASKYVFTHSAFRRFKGELGAMALLFWVDLLMIPIYLVWTLSTGELQGFAKTVFPDQPVFWQMTGTAALGGVRALTQYVVLVFVTATSMSTANTFTQILNILISMPIQHTAATPALVAGIILVVLASSAYTAIKAYKPFLPWLDETLCCKPPPPPAEVSKPLASS
jgi:drug/metabolite transporter (DMT)-like permease